MILSDLIIKEKLETAYPDGSSYYTDDMVFFESKKEAEKFSVRQRIAYATDYAVMNYALLSGERSGFKNKQSIWYNLRSAYNENNIYKVKGDGEINVSSSEIPYSCIRPVLHLNTQNYLTIRKIFSKFSKLGVSYNYGYDNSHTLTLGEYPKTYVGDELNSELESNKFSLKKTGKKWLGYLDENGNYIQNEEYIYNEKKYVRVKTNKYDGDSEYSDRTKAPEPRTYEWVSVEPITWIIRNWDELPIEINPNGNGKAKFIDIQTEEGIASGIPFSTTESSVWKNSFIRNFLNNEFLKSAFSCFNYVFADINQNINNHKKTRLEKLNPDKTPKSKIRKMTDTEIIQNWIEAGSSVLLRGPSGIGKTERIKKLYPDLIYIKLTNNMFPEKVVGSMNLQTGQIIPPDFAKQALLSCANDNERKLINENIQNLYDLADQIYERSKNSNDKVVILLDELLNVKPAIQSLVYTLVLNKLVETGKGLKLPANTVIVATGNQKKYSSVAEDLAEPLEKRFDHILDMEPKVSEWIYEYAIPNKIHPSVIGYIFLKYQQNKKSELLENIGYFYEEPEVGELHLDRNGCKGRTNDPRGWVSISNMLYSFESDLKNGKLVGKDVADLLKTSINSKLRDEWSNEFFDFYNNPTLTVEEVIGKQFTQADLPRNINEKFATMVGLLSANEKQVKTVREFIRLYCDPEYLSIYDIYWTGHDEERMQIITELQEMSFSNEGELTL